MSGRRVGIVGDPELASVVEVLDYEAILDPAEFDDAELVVAAGEAVLVDLVREAVSAPVLPVDAGAGVRSVPRADVESALETVLEGAHETTTHSVIAARHDGNVTRALFDVALVAAEPARISEYAIHCGSDRVGRFRADGVVASTPAGSVGYNRAADGPVVAPGTDVLSVVPIAPFATAADRWVLPSDEVTISVERDETPVELLADGRPEWIAGAGDRFALGQAGEVETVVVPESGPFY